jgi:hypothetical protein
LSLVFDLDVLERFDKFFEYVDKIFSLVIVLDDRFLSFVVIHLALKLFPEIPVLVDEHFEPFFDVFVILVVVVAVIELLDGLGEFVVDLNQFFQGLLQ